MDLLHRQGDERHAHENRQPDDGPGPGEADRPVRAEPVDDFRKEILDGPEEAGNDHGPITGS